MSLQISFSNDNNQERGSLIQKELDPNKYLEISEKLCAKRLLLEEDLVKTELLNAEREDKALDLMRLKESMQLFGISEVDYQVYLVKKLKNENN